MDSNDTEQSQSRIETLLTEQNELLRGVKRQLQKIKKNMGQSSSSEKIGEDEKEDEE